MKKAANIIPRNRIIKYNCKKKKHKKGRKTDLVLSANFELYVKKSSKTTEVRLT